MIQYTYMYLLTFMGTIFILSCAPRYQRFHGDSVDFAASFSQGNTFGSHSLFLKE